MRTHKVRMPRNMTEPEMTDWGHSDEGYGESSFTPPKVRTVPTLAEFRQRGGALIHGPECYKGNTR